MSDSAMGERAIINASKPGWQSTEALLTGALAWVCREATARKPENSDHATTTIVAVLCLTIAVVAYSRHRSNVKRASLDSAKLAASPSGLARSLGSSGARNEDMEGS